MNFKKLFFGVKNINVQQAKAMMGEYKQGDIQLLDVRQPIEYKEGHLASSQLIPLKELSDRANELSREKPVVVYCAIGGRSRVAAQLLVGKDFPEVFNLKGGIKAWSGHVAVESEEYGLDLLVGDEDYNDAVSLAYAMEDGLQKFYLALAEGEDNEELRKLYLRLSLFEEKHKAKLIQESQGLGQDKGIQVNPDPDVITEGGRRVSELVAQTEAYRQTPRDVVEMAMIIETQALDLYHRLARKSKKENTQALFLRLAEEENVHLSYLANEFDRLFGQ